MNNLGEHQTKIILERISQVEKHYSDLCEKFAAVTRKLSRVRDKNDDLAKSLKNFADSEKYNESLELSLNNLTQALVLIADNQDLEVKRIEEKVVLELAQYKSEICRNALDEVKSQILLRDKEIARRRQLETLRSKYNRRPKNATTEAEIMKSNMEINKILKEIQEISDSFEKQKYDDLKAILTDFILIQLKSHATSVELLTAAYNDINEMDEKKDFQAFGMEIKKINRQFKKLLQHPDDPSQGYFLNRLRSQSLGALSSMFTSSSSSKEPKEAELPKKRTLKTFAQSTMSLNSLDSQEEEIRKESKPIVLTAESVTTKTSDSDEDSSADDNSNESDTTEEEIDPRLARYQARKSH